MGVVRRERPGGREKVSLAIRYANRIEGGGVMNPLLTLIQKPAGGGKMSRNGIVMKGEKWGVFAVRYSYRGFVVREKEEHQPWENI